MQKLIRVCDSFLKFSVPRGTKAFKIEVSMDKEVWTEAVSDTLTDVRGMACENVPLEEFPPSGGVAVVGRYVKFTMSSIYGNGGGLRFFNVIHRDNHICRPHF